MQTTLERSLSQLHLRHQEESATLPTTQREEAQAASHLLATSTQNFQIDVRTTDGLSAQIDLAPTSTVKELKQSIEQYFKIPAEDQFLLHGGMKVHQRDDCTVGECIRLPGRTVLLSMWWCLFSRVVRSLRRYNTGSTKKRLGDSASLLSAETRSQTKEDAVETPPNEEFQIFVKNLNGRTVTLAVKATDTVDSLREQVERKTGIPPSEQRLLFGGKQLEPGKLLADYDVSKESTLHLGEYCSSEGGLSLTVFACTSSAYAWR